MSRIYELQVLYLKIIKIKPNSIQLIISTPKPSNRHTTTKKLIQTDLKKTHNQTATRDRFNRFRRSRKIPHYSNTSHGMGNVQPRG